MAKNKSKFYVVWNGRRKGIFTSWEDTEAQVKGYAGATFKSFETKADAERAFSRTYEEFKGKTAVKQKLVTLPPAVYPSWSVDAACSGNPGLMEYRCVETDTAVEIFHRGPFPEGTNNVGEFLAIVDALILAKQRGITFPIYSDSINAMSWVRGKKAKTSLKITEKNEEIFVRLEQAEKWLSENSFSNKLLKWQTSSWGENPADFGRK